MHKAPANLPTPKIKKHPIGNKYKKKLFTEGFQTQYHQLFII